MKKAGHLYNRNLWLAVIQDGLFYPFDKKRNEESRLDPIYGFCHVLNY